MAMNIDTIMSAAMALPPKTCAALAEKLLESLEGQDEAAIRAAWTEEAEKRLEAYDQGTMKVIPGDEAMRALTAKKTP